MGLLNREAIYLFIAAIAIAGTAMAIQSLDSYFQEPQYENVSTMRLELPFEDEIPEKYSKYGNDVSPSVGFSDIPKDAKTIALIVDDPDAPTPEPWVHWLIWNIPADSDLPEGLPGNPRVQGAAQGENDFGNLGYGGPKPPAGTHTYRFQAYALDTELDLEPGAGRDALESVMEGHVVARGSFEADYTR